MDNQAAKAIHESTDTGARRQFCTFLISGRLFGVDILDVKEINDETNFTTIFHAASEIRGYVNIRGVIHLVLDLGMLLGVSDTNGETGKKLVIFKPTVAPSFGVLVDGIGDVVEVAEDEIDTRLSSEDVFGDQNDQRARAKELMTGVCKLEGQLLVILSAKKFLDTVSD